MVLARESPVVPSTGLGLDADEEGDSNPALSRVTDWMEFSEAWFAKISSPLMQPKGLPATKALLVGRWFKN